MDKLKIEYVPIDSIKPYPGNAKLHTPEQIEQIKKSMQEFGNIDPVGIWHNEIVEGHGRYQAAKSLGYETIPVIKLDSLTDEQRRAYGLIHNQLTINTGFDIEALQIELDSIGNIDMSDFGFDIDLDEEEPTEIVEDEVPDVPEESKAKLGDLWILGNSRLICGDSTDVAVIDRLMDGVKANMVFTDPPYGMSLDTDYSSVLGSKKLQAKFIKEKGIKGGRDYEKVKGDNTDFTPELVTTIFSNFDYCKEIFIWGCDYYPDLIKGFKDGCCMVWDKKANDGVTTNMTEAYTSDFELVWSKNKHKKSIIRVLWALVFGTEQEFDHKRYHPTQKPTKLSRWFIERFSEEQQIVVDLYGGSGSTLIACEQLNRKCYMCELDPKYVSVIVQRWLNLTGRKDEIFCIRDGQKLIYDDIFN